MLALEETAFAATPDPGVTAEQQQLADEDRRALDEAFATLPEDVREVVTLYYREGASAPSACRRVCMAKDVRAQDSPSPFAEHQRREVVLPRLPVGPAVGRLVSEKSAQCAA